MTLYMLCSFACIGVLCTLDFVLRRARQGKKKKEIKKKQKQKKEGSQSMASQNDYVHRPSARIIITMDRGIIIDQQPMTEETWPPCKRAHITAARLRVIARG